MDSIQELRKQVDAVHEELHALLLRRRDLTMAIWKIKSQQNEPFHNSERENQILNDFINLQKTKEPNDPLMDELLRNVMKTILKEYESYLKAQFQQG